MSLIGQTPVHRMMEEEAARSKARNDWAYQDEMRKLREKSVDQDEPPKKSQ